MMIFFLALIPLLAVNGESCNNVEDPIKRDETASGPWNVSRVEWKPSGLQVPQMIKSLQLTDLLTSGKGGVLT